jgi:hypothetical protein
MIPAVAARFVMLEETGNGSKQPRGNLTHASERVSLSKQVDTGV